RPDRRARRRAGHRGSAGRASRRHHDRIRTRARSAGRTPPDGRVRHRVQARQGHHGRHAEVDAVTAFTHVQPGTAAASLSGDLLAAYTEGLREYLARRDEQGLLRAYEIGRRAFSLGNGVLDMAAAHSRALAAVLAATPQADAAAAAEAFLCEALSPFEVTYRTFRDANATLRRLNDMLEEQARRLAYTLHDEVTQTLASAHLRLADAAAALPPGARAALRDVR